MFIIALFVAEWAITVMCNKKKLAKQPVVYPYIGTLVVGQNWDLNVY